MPTICFMYKMNDNPKIHYGKYVVDYISDDHEGLDVEIISILEKKYNTPSIIFTVGIISCSTNFNSINYSTEKEYTFFDFYYVSHDNMHKYENILYIDGKLIT